MNCYNFSSLFLVALVFLVSPKTHAQHAPPLPYILEGACPFECCMYGDWTAGQRIPVYRNQSDTTQIHFNIEAGDTFQAPTGNVIVSEPGIVGVHKSYELYGYYSPANNTYRKKPVRNSISEGDTLFVLDYMGEGFWNVWYQGEIYQEDGMEWRFGRYPENRSADEVRATFLKHPETEWWVKIRTQDKKEGWILMKNIEVSGHDGCG